MPYPSIYRAKAVAIRLGVIEAFVPQVFGESLVLIRDAVGTLPTESTMGWVFFQAGNPEFPVWASTGVAAPSGGNGDGGPPPVIDVPNEVWIGVAEPTDPDIELWFDPDAPVPGGGGGGGGGTTILDGAGPPAAMLGATGNYYADTLNGILYGPKTGTSITGAVLIEPFDTLTAWSGSGGSIVAGGRTGNALQLPGTQTYTWTIPAASESATVTMGMAYRVSSLAANRHPIQLRSDAGTTNHITLRVHTDGSLAPMRGGVVGAELASTAVGLVVINTWVYLELQVYLHDTAGTVTLSVNGTQVVNLTNVDTKNAGTKTTFDQLALIGTTGSTETYDDLYFMTGAGAVFNGDTAVTAPTWPVTVRTVPGGGGVSTFVYNQGTPSATWVITHNLNSYPNVTVEDSAGSTIEGEIVFNSVNQITLTFSAAFSGVAYLS